MGTAVRYVLRIFVLLSLVAAQEAVNKAASSSEYNAPLMSKADVMGTASSYGDAELVKAPKWAQWTSLGLGVWRMLLFVVTMCKYMLRPVLYVAHILHSILRPITLLVQLIYHVFIGIPLSVITRLSATLYPAYLFLGSAAIIGLSIGLGIAVMSKLLGVLLPSNVVAEDRPAYDSIMPPSPGSRRSASKQRISPLSVKRSPPTTRSIMSSQPSLQTPTIFEESELSPYDDDAFNTDSDGGTGGHTPIKPSKGYLDYKPIGADGTRRRKF